MRLSGDMWFVDSNVFVSVYVVDFFWYDLSVVFMDVLVVLGVLWVFMWFCIYEFYGIVM